MDYRNADGSTAQMCGNGMRVFAHYLRVSGMEARDEFVIGSLAGPRAVDRASRRRCHRRHQRRDGQGQPAGYRHRHRRRTTSHRCGRSTSATRIWPVWCRTLTADELDALDIGAPVEFDPVQFPDGVNIEVLTAPVNAAVAMRVHERGVGETRSCGTGTVAATLAALAHQGARTGSLRVRVPGGEVSVEISETTSFLRGPSVLVARGEIVDSWWTAQR